MDRHFSPNAVVRMERTCVCIDVLTWYPLCMLVSLPQWYHVRDFRNAASPNVGDRRIYENANAKDFVRGGDGIFVRVQTEGDGNPLQGLCDDMNDECASWADSGECENNPGYMRVSCKRSCGLCPPT